MEPILEFRDSIQIMYPDLKTNIFEVGPNPTWMLEIFTFDSRIDVIWGVGLSWGISELTDETEDESWFIYHSDIEFDNFSTAFDYVINLIEKRKPTTRE